MDTNEGPTAESSAERYAAAVRRHGDPVRVLAESAILRYIGELAGDAEARYREMNAVCFPGGDGVAEFEVFAAVTLGQIAGVRALWAAEKAKEPGLAPAAFAREHARDVFAPGVEICDPPPAALSGEIVTGPQEGQAP